MESPRDLFTIDFIQKSFDNVCTEILYPFGNFQGRHMSKFCIAIHSPSQFYYTDLFASFILSPDQAYRLYFLLLTEQQVDPSNASPESILESIPDHLQDIEKQFKKYYEIAYYNVVAKLNFDTNSEIIKSAKSPKTKPTPKPK